MHKRIARAQLVARRKKEEGSAEAVRDAKLAGRHGEHAKGMGSRALLFEPLDADFKLQPLINLPILEVASFSSTWSIWLRADPTVLQLP